MWFALFAASNFANYGEVKCGIKIDATIERRDGTNAVVTVGVADLTIAAANANASAGTPVGHYAVKGCDLYLKTQLVEGVQHYTKQTMVHDAEIGWGAEWHGDYIMDASGNFVEAD